MVKKKVVKKEGNVVAGEQGEAEAVSPDVCETPSPPAPSVPVPYPNTALASDSSSGAKKVKAEGKEVGDEAGNSGGSLSKLAKAVKDHPLWVVGSLVVLFVVVVVLLSNISSSLELIEEGPIQEIIALLSP